jgi:hypothetical protein
LGLIVGYLICTLPLITMQLEYTITQEQQQHLLLFRKHLLNSLETKGFSWEYSISILFDLGIGMEETMQFVYLNRPNEDEFMHWIIQHVKLHETFYDHDDNEDVLSEEELDFWDENGYLVLRGAVSKADCKQASDAIWDFLGASLDDQESWYKPHPAKKGMMVVFTQHEALQKIRNSAKIRKAYEQLYGTKEIYKTIDKVSFNAPDNHVTQFKGSPLHWDVSLSLPIAYKLQGLLYLNDVTSESGAFQCVPGFHLEIDCWLNNLPAGTDPHDYARNTLHPISVPGNTGDFIIWNQALPHSATPNKGKYPRLVQYLTYLPKIKRNSSY